MTSTRISSGPLGTGEQKSVFAEVGRRSGSPSSSCIARRAIVIKTPPDGEKNDQSSETFAVYQPGAFFRRSTAVSRFRSAGGRVMVEV